MGVHFVFAVFLLIKGSEVQGTEKGGNAVGRGLRERGRGGGGGMNGREGDGGGDAEG